MVNRGHGNGKLTAERESLRPIQAKIEDGIAGRITESQIHVKLDVVESNWPFFFFFFWFLFCWTGRESGGITIDTGSAGPGPEAPESAPDGLHKV